MNSCVQKEDCTSVDHPVGHRGWSERNGKDNERDDIEDEHSVGDLDEALLAFM